MILLFFLTGKFPLFQSNDDVEALLEISCIVGRRRMEKAATLHCQRLLYGPCAFLLIGSDSPDIHNEHTFHHTGREALARICGVTKPEVTGAAQERHPLSALQSERRIFRRGLLRPSTVLLLITGSRDCLM
jgi:hypothetical protein